MRLSWLRLGAICTVCIGLGFATWSFAVRSPLSPWYVARWKDVGQGFERLEFVSEDEVNVLLYRFDPRLVNMRIEMAANPERVKSWATNQSGQLFINGFYFLADNTPAGLLMTDGQVVGKLSFDYDKSGIIQLAPDFTILDTGLESFDRDGLTEAGQSYPFLLKHGEHAIKEDSRLSARRTFMGNDEQGMAYVGVVWRDDVSLYELATILQEIEISWDDVLNLDGGPSTGLVAEMDGFSEILDSAAPVPQIIVIEQK